jgi:fatty acid desaturase
MADDKTTHPIGWYRTHIDNKVLQELHARSDLLAFAQSLGHLGLLAITGGTAWYAAGRWPWPLVVLIVFLHGTCYAFMINAVHELGHNTVFRTKSLNSFFCHVFAFLGWINHYMFQASHARHHRYTLHPPNDLEVVLPVKIVRKQFYKSAIANPMGIRWLVGENLRIARGKLRGEWELRLFPESEPEKRRPAMNWSRAILAGHAMIYLVSLAGVLLGHLRFGMLPLLTSLAPLYGGWLFFLCNNTQHIGLKDNVPDFRLSCRSFMLNPIAKFLYWHMNYHIEHHMYAAVPCYKLGKLHRIIEHDLPPTPRGIAATWRDIAAIQAIQAKDPKYQHLQAAPNPVLA